MSRSLFASRTKPGGGESQVQRMTRTTGAEISYDPLSQCILFVPSLKEANDQGKGGAGG